jgi:hypothetical protein
MLTCPRYYSCLRFKYSVITPGSAAQPEVLQASNIQDDRHVGRERRRQSRDPTLRDVDVEEARQEEVLANIH